MADAHAFLPHGLTASLSRRCPRCAQEKACDLSNHVTCGYFLCLRALKGRRQVRRGEFLFHNRDPISTFYLVRMGSIKTERVTREGQLIVTGFHFAGDLVAPESLATARHVTDAIALENSEVCEFDRQSVMALCSEEPMVSTWLIQQLGMHLKDKDAALCWATRMRCSDRVLRFFVELHDRLQADARAPSGRAPKPMSKHDIAMYLHMTPETLSRTIGELRDAGWLQVKASEFTLTDVELARRRTRL